MRILIIDGQGGKLGKELVELVLEKFPELDLTAVGTNTIATTSMIKGGAKQAATGENAVIVGCRKADIIVGPIGITIADSMFGEITPKMAVAVGQSDATKIFIPSFKCNNLVAGVSKNTMSAIIDDVILKIQTVLTGNC